MEREKGWQRVGKCLFTENLGGRKDIGAVIDGDEWRRKGAKRSYDLT